MNTYPKLIKTLLSAGIIALSVGCSQEDDLVAPSSTPQTVNAVSVGTEPVQTGVAIYAQQLTAPTPVAAPVTRDAEQSAALADASEQTYMAWNNALTEFHRQHGRWPTDLTELKTFQPDLQQHHAPNGFTLVLDGNQGVVTFARKHPPTQAAATRPFQGF